MNTVSEHIVSDKVDTQRKEWFDNMINDLSTDKSLMDVGLLDKKREEMYQAFINNDNLKIFDIVHTNLHKDLTELIILSFLSELKKKNTTVNKLAFDTSSKGLLIWAVINNNDEETEKNLILSEAKVNHELANTYDYYITTTIVEESDNLDIPKQYKQFA